MFVSQPHFLNGEKKLLNDVSGLSPNDLAHDSIIQFEPVKEYPLYFSYYWVKFNNTKCSHHITKKKFHVKTNIF